MMIDNTPTEKQLNAICLIERNTDYKFNGKTKSDAIKFIGLHMEESKSNFKNQTRPNRSYISDGYEGYYDNTHHRDYDDSYDDPGPLGDYGYTEVCGFLGW